MVPLIFGMLLGRFINIQCCPFCHPRPRHQCICLNIGTVCWVFGIWLQTSLQQKGKFPSLKPFPFNCSRHQVHFLGMFAKRQIRNKGSWLLHHLMVAFSLWVLQNFGGLIPGHGGVVDRCDCMFLMAAFINVYLSVVDTHLTD